LVKHHQCRARYQRVLHEQVDQAYFKLFGSLTVSVPLSITLDSNIPLFPKVAVAGPSQPIHTTHSKINAAIQQNASLSMPFIPSTSSTPYTDTQPLKKEDVETWRPGAEANVYNTDTSVPESQSNKRPTWVSKRGTINHACSARGDTTRRKVWFPDACMLQRLLPTPVILCRQIHNVNNGSLKCFANKKKLRSNA
jgi:hypothetical protein